MVSKFDEDLDKVQFSSAADYAKATATHKAVEVADRLERDKDEKTPFMIIGSDTVVEAPDGSIMEKPSDETEAMAMLLSLQGVTHQVHSGVGIVFPDPSRPGGRLVKSFSETTRVTFAPLREAEMAAYIKTGEPFDKAGGYGTSLASNSKHLVFSLTLRASIGMNVVDTCSTPCRYPRSGGRVRELYHRLLLQRDGFPCAQVRERSVSHDRRGRVEVVMKEITEGDAVHGGFDHLDSGLTWPPT